MVATVTLLKPETPLEDLLLALRVGEVEVPVDLLLADHSRNLSRSGLPHDLEGVRAMAELLLKHGQLSAAEVRLPEDGEVERRPRLVFGFRRHAAVMLLRAEGRTSPQWQQQGLLRCGSSPAGLSDADLEDRNLVENLGHLQVSFIDLGLAALRLSAAPEDGGRGEEASVVANKLRVPQAFLGRLLLLPQLCPEARELSRLHHRDPERGINNMLALKLARRSVEEQLRIIGEATINVGRSRTVTPKSVRAVIAPHQGRQGQPPGATGAQLTRTAVRLARVERDPGEQKRWGCTAEQAALVRHTCLALVSLDPAALKALPGRLGKLIEHEFTREPEEL